MQHHRSQRQYRNDRPKRALRQEKVACPLFLSDGRFNLLTITDARGITYLTNTYVTTNEPGRRPLDPAVETLSRPRVRDGAALRVEQVFRRMGEWKSCHDRVFEGGGA